MEYRLDRHDRDLRKRVRSDEGGRQPNVGRSVRKQRNDGDAENGERGPVPEAREERGERGRDAAQRDGFDIDARRRTRGDVRAEAADEGERDDGAGR
jgi:hypothetical protein